MNTINGNFIEKTIPDTKNATLAVNIGGVDSTMTVEKFGAAIVPPLPSSVLKLDTDINSNLQTVKDVTGNASSLQISTNTARVVTPLASPFKIKGKDTSGGQFDVEAFSNVSQEYLGLRLRGVAGEYYAQFYYSRELTQPSYLAIRANEVELMQFVGETNVKETLIPNGKLGIGVARSTVNNGTNIASSAKVQIDSTTQGFLMPRMTTAEINAIVSPANGLMVYNTTLKTLCSYDGTVWNNATPYRKYVAIINQTAGNIPVATILENTFSGAPYFTRIEVSTGFWVYNLILDGAFVANKTFIQATAFYKDSGNNTREFLIFRTSNDVCQMSNTTGTDGVLLNISIEIRVYN
jgi:hypothetical protein